MIPALLESYCVYLLLLSTCYCLFPAALPAPWVENLLINLVHHRLVQASIQPTAHTDVLHHAATLIIVGLLDPSFFFSFLPFVSPHKLFHLSAQPSLNPSPPRLSRLPP